MTYFSRLIKNLISPSQQDAVTSATRLQAFHEHHAGHDQTSHIHVVCVGATEKNFKFFLNVRSTSYKCSSLLEAEAADYKIGTLFNYRFPMDAQPVLQFISQFIYDVEMKRIHLQV